MNRKQFTSTSLILLAFASNSAALGSSVLLLSDENINTDALQFGLSDIQPNQFDTKQPKNLIQQTHRLILQTTPKGEVSYQ
ncbi:hypothetical protein N8878_08410 [Psychromonas sp.]|nr:hypothetical protein [Psychromonas sp.]